MGLIIPALAAIVPIIEALNKTLIDSLTHNRTQTSGTSVTITDAKSLNQAPLITFGVVTVGYGAMLYYVFPLSILSMNFSLLLFIFFFILVGMIAGLAILAFNL